MDQLLPYLQKIAKTLDRLDPLLPPEQHDFDFKQAIAFRWQKGRHSRFGRLVPITRPATIEFGQLQGIDQQVTQIRENTEQFLAGLPANHVLLTGARGTGKSSIVKAILATYHTQNLKMVEIESQDLADLPELLTLLENAPYSFIIFCDDLSFEANDASYKPLKALLDGSLSSPAPNILLYATSNRRHLLPESMQDNLAQYNAQEVHPQEAVEEKISLSERFGIWINFYPHSQAEYLTIVKSWLQEFAPEINFDDAIKRAALQFSQARSARSGRVAYQFVKQFVGQRQLQKAQFPQNS